MWLAIDRAEAPRLARLLAAERAERGEIEAADESEVASENDAECDSAEERVALESVVEHVSVDDPESGFETAPVDAEGDDCPEADGGSGPGDEASDGEAGRGVDTTNDDATDDDTPSGADIAGAESGGADVNEDEPDREDASEANGAEDASPVADD